MSVTRKTARECPYCCGPVANHAARRPGQMVVVCSDCGKYSVLSERTGAVYPVSNPADPASLPATKLP